MQEDASAKGKAEGHGAKVIRRSLRQLPRLHLG